MSYQEYQLHVRHVQRSPWRWGLYLKEDEETNETADGSQGGKELSDKEYRKILVEESADASRAGIRHY